jgi:hemolysin activation/secretion protein
VLSIAEGTRIAVTAFRFAGNRLLAEETLQSAVQPYIGRTVGFTELQEASQAVTAAYRAAGWMARAHLPSQDVTEGIVTLQVVEAVFGGARLEGAAPTRVSSDAVLKWFSTEQPVGQAVNIAALDRALLLADDLPGVAVAGALTAGAADGKTELVLKMTDEMGVVGEAALDNTGARATASDRTSLNLVFNSPLRMADQLSLNLAHTQGSTFGRAAWTFPVGLDGLRAGFNVSQMDYHLLATEFEALQGRGQSASQGLELSHPLLRARQRNLVGSLAYDSKAYQNSANRATQSDYRLTNWTLGVSGNAFDTWGGGGADSAALAWTTGHLDQGGLDAAENPDQAGAFERLRYALSRQQMLGEALSLYLTLSGQQTSKDLDTSERFYLGGVSGVRAYPPNEGSGSRGQLLNAELRWRLPDNWVLTTFYDAGQASSPDTGASVRLDGFGLGLNWSTPWGFDFKAIWARRDGSNTNPRGNGQDQDGTLVRDRLWFTLSFPFSVGAGTPQ